MTQDAQLYQDLPALRTSEELLDLPALLPGMGPRRREVPALHAGWSTHANQRHVNGLVRNPRTGELWLATAGGVLHWAADMRAFTRYGSEHGLQGQVASAIGVDSSQRVWAASQQGGISYFDGALWQPYPFLSDARVTCMYADGRGSLWLGTTRGVALLGDPMHTPRVEIPYSGDAPRMLAVSRDGSGALQAWFCNARGIVRTTLREEGDRILTAEEGWELCLAQIGILTLACSGEQLWLGTVSGLFLLDTQTMAVTRQANWPSAEVTALALMAQNEGVWYASGAEIGQATARGCVPFGGEALAALVHGRISGMAPQENDTVWVSTHDGLLAVTRTEGRFHLTDEPPDVIGFPHPGRQPPVPLSNFVQALAVQQRPEKMIVWIGTAAGLFSLDSETGAWGQSSPHGLKDIRALLVSREGDGVAIASWIGGVYLAGEPRTMQLLSAEISGPLTALATGSDGSWWAAGLNGLYQRRCDALDWTLELSSERLPASGWIRSLQAVSPTELWIGTTDGFFVYHADRRVLIPVLSIPADCDVCALLSFSLDEKQHCWVGTDDGLYIGSSQNLNALQKLHALSARSISALLFDQNARSVWVGTKQGLYALTLREGAGWVIEHAWTLSNSGLAADSITALALGKGARQEQCLWIGTPCGLSCFTYSA